MMRWSSLPHRFLAALATVFAAAAIFYAGLWMYVERTPGSRVELGFNSMHANQYDGTTHCMKVADVVPHSPAERAGLRAGDRITGVDGQALATSAPFDQAYARGKPGDAITFTIQREGVPNPIEVHGIFRASTESGPPEGFAKTSAVEVTRSFPVLFLLVGLPVLFLRLNDPNAWLLASLFCGFVAEPGFSHQLMMSPAVGTFALAYQAIFSAMLCPLFYIFFAVFPARSPLDRRFPWLKWIGLGFGLVMAVAGVAFSDMRAPGVAADVFGERAGEIVRLSLIYGSYLFLQNKGERSKLIPAALCLGFLLLASAALHSLSHVQQPESKPRVIKSTSFAISGENVQGVTLSPNGSEIAVVGSQLLPSKEANQGDRDLFLDIWSIEKAKRIARLQLSSVRYSRWSQWVDATLRSNPTRIENKG
jgi:PDZ domain-containing protein